MTGPESPDDWSEHWDDVVDVICVGSTPGVLAYLNACAAADLDVLHVEQPAEFDDETRLYFAAMTEDLDTAPTDDNPADTEPAVIGAVPAPLRRDARGRPDTLDTFFGEQLREWSARCARSPYAVMFTQVPDQFIRMRADTGEIITALAIPVNPGVAENDSGPETFGGLLYENGRLAGATVTGPSGPRRVRSDAGLALPIGPAGQWPQHDCAALVSRPAGRFARLEVVLQGPDGDD